MLMLAPAALAQDLFRRAPLLCDEVPANHAVRQSPLDTTIPEIQMDVQPDPLPLQSTEMCMHTATTAGSAGHTFPSAYAGKYVTIRSVIVTASGLNKDDNGAYWFAVQPLRGGDAYAGLEVYSEVYTDLIEQGDLLDVTGFVRDLGEESMPHVGSWWKTPSTPLDAAGP